MAPRATRQRWNNAAILTGLQDLYSNAALLETADKTPQQLLQTLDKVCIQSTGENSGLLCLQD